jgi:hypothetical protein
MYRSPYWIFHHAPDNGPMMIGAEELRIGATLKTGAAQPRDGEITVLSPLFARQACSRIMTR